MRDWEQRHSFTSALHLSCTWLAGTRVMSRVLQWEQCQGCGWGEQAAGGVLVKVETTPLINPAPAQPQPSPSPAHIIIVTLANYAASNQPLRPDSTFRDIKANSAASLGGSVLLAVLIWNNMFHVFSLSLFLCFMVVQNISGSISPQLRNANVLSWQQPSHSQPAAQPQQCQDCQVHYLVSALARPHTSNPRKTVE